MVALIIIFDKGPCGIFQVMKDHYNDIEHYTPLTVHAVYINSNNDLSKNDIPCCNFKLWKIIIMVSSIIHLLLSLLYPSIFMMILAKIEFLVALFEL